MSTAEIRAPDPLGRALLDYLDGDAEARVLTWSSVEGWDVLPAARLCRDRRLMPEVERRAVDACEGRVLDWGAGAGSHALCLQQAGHEVTGLDISPGCVEAMRRRGVARPVFGNGFEWSGGRFDTILMMMNGIGVCGTLHGLRRFFRTAPRLLAPGGSVIFDSADIVYIFHDLPGGRCIDLRKDYYGEVTYRMKYRNEATEPFGWLFVDFAMLAGEARRAGWEAEMIWEGKDYEYAGRIWLPDRPMA